MSQNRLWFTKNGRDITDGIELRNGKANTFGWSTHEVWLTEQAGEEWLDHKIGDLYCGAPKNMADGFGFRLERTGGEREEEKVTPKPAKSS